MYEHLVYSKSAEEGPIKSGHHVSSMKIDQNNNIYLAVAADIYIWSIDRLSRGLDWLIDIVRVQQYERQVQEDSLTNAINRLDVEQAIDFIIDESTMDNKLMKAETLRGRMQTLNRKSLKILNLSLGSQTNPSICLTLNDGTMMLLKYQEGQYRPDNQPAYNKNNIRLAQYIDRNTLAILTDKEITILKQQQVKLESSIKDGVINVAYCQSQSGGQYAFLYPSELYVATVTNKNQIQQENIKLQEMCEWIHMTDKSILLASNKGIYTIDLNKNKEILSFVPFLTGTQKMLLMDSGQAYTTKPPVAGSHKARQIAMTANKLMVVITEPTGNYKEADLLVLAKNTHDVLKNCLDNLEKSDRGKVPLTFNDIRLMRHRQLFTQLLQTVMMLHDPTLMYFIRNPKERKLNMAISQTYQSILASFANPKLLIRKLLINLLIISKEETRELLNQLMMEEIQSHLGFTIDSKKCVDTGQRLADHQLVQCRQCQTYRKAKNSAKCCYICWGQITW